MYPSNELGDQLQETERRESELSSKSCDLESKLLSKIKEAAEEVERKVGELLRTGDVCVCAVLVSLVLACSWPCSPSTEEEGTSHHFIYYVLFILHCTVYY